MEEAEPEELKMVTRSSTKRKPFSDLTNLISDPYHHSSSFSKLKKPKSTVAGSPLSHSSVGSTKNPIHVQHPSTVPPDHHPLRFTPLTPSSHDWLGDENHIAYSRGQTSQKARSRTNAAPALINLTSMEKIKNDGNEISMALRSSMVDKTMDKGKAMASTLNQPSLERTCNDEENKRSTFCNFSLLEKIKDKRSCRPLSRTRSNRNEIDGAGDALESKSPTYPPLNNKKGRCSLKGSYVFPQDFIDQQRAYFKEIDEFELEVEEV